MPSFFVAISGNFEQNYSPDAGLECRDEIEDYGMVEVMSLQNSGNVVVTRGCEAFSSCSNYFIFSRLETLAGVKANVAE